ncbi:MAG TPA: type II toxin-antitoxin system VapC family toxin [Bryobacteraceae bacterium]|jgi:uncharacterized protein with PIN domain|nr:type II toxin-antitoxin system VapC family toxin [Bryobacteraceae bacterium]
MHLREPGYERLIDRIDAAEVVIVGVPAFIRFGRGRHPTALNFMPYPGASVAGIEPMKWNAT